MLTWNIETSETLTDFQRTRLVSELGPVIRIVAVDERSQTRNRDIALERLRDRVRPRWPSVPAGGRPRRQSPQSLADSQQNASDRSARPRGVATKTRELGL